jgi:hypothetical protein
MMIHEVEEMMPNAIKSRDKKRFPKYLIIREQEN